MGKAETFERGRDLAAWLGLVPRQFTTGGKTKLLGISKRGNKYLRKLLIHGARAALPYVAERDTPLGRWTKALLSRAHPMSSWWRSPTSWPGLHGRCYGEGSLLPRRARPWRRSGWSIRASGRCSIDDVASGDIEMA